MGRLLYKPFGIVLGVIASKLAGKVFRALWTAVDKDSLDGTPPRPTQADAPVAKAVAATAIEAATYAGTQAAFDRVGVRSFHYLTGIWAGPKDKKEERADA
jgi:hypothetical protein